METYASSEPTVIVIAGAGGDLTWRKLTPALYDLFTDNWLPERFLVIGVDRIAMSDDEFRERLRQGVANFLDAARPILNHGMRLRPTSGFSQPTLARPEHSLRCPTNFVSRTKRGM